MTKAEQDDMQRACALVMRSYRRSPNAYIESCVKEYRDASFQRWDDRWVIRVNDPVDDGSPWYHVSTVGACDIPCKQCGVKRASSSMVDDVCLPCYYPAFRDLYQCCEYCRGSEELKPCFICGTACCPEHAYSMRPEVKIAFGIEGYAVECVNCVCK